MVIAQASHRGMCAAPGGSTRLSFVSPSRAPETFLNNLVILSPNQALIALHPLNPIAQRFYLRPYANHLVDHYQDVQFVCRMQERRYSDWPLLHVMWISPDHPTHRL